MAAALVLTIVIAVVEAVGGWLTGSLALLSDAGHMWTDVSALGLALLAAWWAGRPANRKRTYGYVRLEILSALVNGVMLLAITVFIVVEAIERMQRPTHVDLGPMALIATIGLVANLLAMYFLHSGHSLNTRSAFLHVVGSGWTRSSPSASRRSWSSAAGGCSARPWTFSSRRCLRTWTSTGWRRRWRPFPG
jgi:cobalt-zinc-cadmium efflux system protein